MAYISYPHDSMYATTPQLSWRIGRYEHRSIPPASGDREFTITHAYALRPDKLAAELYGSAHLGEVFMLRNMNLLRDPVFDFVEGLTIVVPSPDTVRAIFG